MTNAAELKAECIKHGLTIPAVAYKLGIDPSTMHRKIRGDNEFTRNELQMLRELLKLSNKRFLAIFFSN